ncbi:hypothetical protein DUNSADRAFT_6076, partial [Dunaliella salina]
FAAEWDIDVASLSFWSPDTVTGRENQPVDPGSAEEGAGIDPSSTGGTGGGAGGAGGGAGAGTEVITKRAGLRMGAERSEGHTPIVEAKEGAGAVVASVGKGAKEDATVGVGAEEDASMGAGAQGGAEAGARSDGGVSSAATALAEDGRRQQGAAAIKGEPRRCAKGLLDNANQKTTIECSTLPNNNGNDHVQVCAKAAKCFKAPVQQRSSILECFGS